MQAQKQFGNGGMNSSMNLEQDGLKKQIALLDQLSVKVDELFAIKQFRH